MPALNDEDVKRLRALLDARETQLQGEVRDAKEADNAEVEGFAGVAPDMVDIAQTKRMADVRHAERERDQLELIEIANSRDRMADGSYGECTDCGEPIGLARLQVQPWASRCVDCQEAYEHAHPVAVPVVPTGRDIGLI